MLELLLSPGCLLADRVPNLRTCEIHLLPFSEHLVAAHTSGTGGVVVFPSCLQDPAADVPVTCLTFNAELGVVVSLAIRNTILANVLPREDDTTGLAFETADMPLLVQCQE